MTQQFYIGTYFVLFLLPKQLPIKIESDNRGILFNVMGILRMAPVCWTG
jgi:hypothetical protein